MQAGKARHAKHGKHMRSRLQKARSNAVVDGKEPSVPRGALCTGKINGRQLMAYALWGNARAGLSKWDPVEALSRGTVLERLAWDSLSGHKLRGSTGGRPWFGVHRSMQLALAICGAICTGRILPWVGVPGSRANVGGTGEPIQSRCRCGRGQSC
jgi:hypothetical protein